MRRWRIAVASTVALLLYVTATLVAAPLQSNMPAQTAQVLRPVAGLAYADAASDACNEVTNKTQNQACTDGYRAYVKDSATDEGTACKTWNGKSQLKFCQQGFAAAQTQAAADGQSNSTFNDDKCASNAAGFGWILCPIIGRVTSFLGDTAATVMQQFLSIQPLQFSGPLYDTWSGVRELANALFVLVFLVLIFAHVLQFELDAYALKKMIPRLAAAAVLVQFSFVLCGALVDVGNILGAGVQGLVHMFTHQGQSPDYTLLGSAASNAATIAAGGVLVSLATLGGALELVGPIAVMLLISVLAMVATLALRYFFIGVLIVASPLAFVAFVLPNTDKYFSKWLSSFVKLILMYPIIMALLSVAGSVDGLLPVTTTSGSTVGHAGQSLALLIIRAFVFIGCFLQVPQTFKWAGGLMDEAHGRLSDIASKGRGAIKESEGYKERKHRMAERRSESVGQLESAINRGTGRAFGAMRGSGSGWLQGIGTEEREAAVASGLLSPAALLLTGSSPSRVSRQRSHSKAVQHEVERMQTFEQAKDMDNIEAVYQYVTAGRLLARNDITQGVRNRQTTIRQDAANKLRTNGAFFLTEHAGSSTTREAMLKMMGEKNYVKPTTLKQLEELGTRGDRQDFGVAERYISPEFAKQPFLAGRSANPDDFGHLRETPVRIMLEGQNAASLARDFHGRNYAIMGMEGTDNAHIASADANRMFADIVGVDAVRANFAIGDRDVMTFDKQFSLLQAMGRSTAYDTGNGADMKRGVVNQILKDVRDPNKPNAHITLLRSLRDMDPAERDPIIASLDAVGREPGNQGMSLAQILQNIPPN